MGKPRCRLFWDLRESGLDDERPTESPRMIVLGLQGYPYHECSTSSRSGSLVRLAGSQRSNPSIGEGRHASRPLPCVTLRL